MRNNYELADVLELGSSEQHILGSKPMVILQVDSTLGMHWRSEPLPDDIDESDE